MFYRAVFQAKEFKNPDFPFPKNQPVWDKTKTSSTVYLLSNNTLIVMPMPSFECNLHGNIIKITYDNGNKYKETILDAEHQKVFAIHVNGKQITRYTRFDVGVFPYYGILEYRLYYTPILEYKYDKEKKQYYIETHMRQVLVRNGLRFLTDYALNNSIGPSTEECSSTWCVGEHTIKIYDKIVQPDGTVSP